MNPLRKPDRPNRRIERVEDKIQEEVERISSIPFPDLVTTLGDHHYYPRVLQTPDRFEPFTAFKRLFLSRAFLRLWTGIESHPTQIAITVQAWSYVVERGYAKTICGADPTMSGVDVASVAFLRSRVQGFYQCLAAVDWHCLQVEAYHPYGIDHSVTWINLLMNTAWHNRQDATDAFVVLNQTLQDAGVASEKLKVAKWPSTRTIFDPHFCPSVGQDEPDGSFDFLHYFPADKRIRSKVVQVSNSQTRELSDLPFGDLYLRVRRQLTELPRLKLNAEVDLRNGPIVGSLLRDWNRVCEFLNALYQRLPWLQFPEQVVLTGGSCTSENEISMSVLGSADTSSSDRLARLAWTILRMASDTAMARHRAFGGTTAIEQGVDGQLHVMRSTEMARRSALLLIPFAVEQAHRLALAPKGEDAARLAMGVDPGDVRVWQGVVRWHGAQDSTPWQLGSWLRQISDPAFAQTIGGTSEQ